MAAIGTLLVFLSLGVFLWAVVGLIRPELAQLPNRVSSVGVWIFSVVLLSIGGALMPDDETSSVASTPTDGQEAVTITEATTAAAERPATSPTETPCIPTELSPAAVELVPLYEELHTFRNDPDFIFSGFGREDWPYFGWMQAIKRHQDTNPGFEMLGELGFLPNEVLMLGMNYVSEEFSESDLAAIEYFERKIQAGLAAARCTELGSVQETIQAALEARRSYVAEDKEAQILARVLGQPVVDPMARREAWVDEWVRAAEAFDAHIAAFQIVKEYADQLSVENFVVGEARGQLLRLERAIDGGEAEAQAILTLFETQPEGLPAEMQAPIDQERQLMERRMAGFAEARDAARELEIAIRGFESESY